MRPDATVYQTLLESGLPGTRVAWPLGKAPALPWFTYKRIRGGEFIADDSDYAFIHRYQVDLYMAEYDEALQESFEGVLGSLGPYVNTNEVWIPSENCWSTSYDLTFNPQE